MAKIRETVDGNGGRHRLFRCPGCDDVHSVNELWTFNGSLEAPTFTPSILVTYYEGQTARARCHSFVTDGKIRFLEDCAHALAGQTIPIPEWDPSWAVG